MYSQTLFVQLTAAAPLHIGCADVYEPTSFIIDQKEKELVHFDTGRFLSLLDSDALAKFSAICRKGTPASLIELMKFMHSKASDILILMDDKRVPVVKALVDHYEQTLNLPLHDKRKVNQELNQFQIMRTAFDFLSGEVYLPGSAVKGAIRTAVLNLRNNGRNFPDFKGKNAGRKLQEHILEFDFRHMESDPFRLIKVSDFFPVDEPKRHILYAVDRKKKPSKFEARAPYQIVEVVETGARFIGTITVFTPPARSPIKRPVTSEEITAALRAFYKKEKQREDRELENIGVKPAPLKINGRCLPCRIGRHSGAECVTVEGHRDIKIMQGKGSKPKSLDHATTVWLASDSRKPTTTESLRPFGWVILEKLDLNAWSDLNAQIKERRHHFQKQQGMKIAAWEEEQSAKKAQHEKELREKEEKEAELAAQQEQEERLRTQWDAMGEEERDLACIRQDEVALKYAAEDAKDPIPNIWPKIESAPPGHQKALARAFKERWQAENKWNVKPKQKKQWKKVQRVKAILGEG